MYKFKKFILILTIVIFLIISISVIATALILFKYSKGNVDSDILNSFGTYRETEFYKYDFTDREMCIGEAVKLDDARLSNGIKYEYVTYNDIPDDLINAFIAIEDKRFFEHHGIDFIRSSKAILNYIFNGKHTFGGSTITQQLIKNLTGNDEVLAERKIKEAFSAINLEKQHDKTEILEMYLNIINLANGCRGVGAAAQLYFDKSVYELDLCECACIAAITNNPSKYDPLKNPEQNRQRLTLILSCMFDLELITEEQYKKANEQKIEINQPQEKNRKYNSWYIDSVTEDVIQDLSAKYNISVKNAATLLYRGGYKIYTAIDTDIQTILDKYYENEINFPRNQAGEKIQSSMIVIDPHTGDILGIAGAVGEKKGNRIQNFATKTKRPPGSTIKPLSVYAPAIDRGLASWSSIIEDSPIGEISGKPWPSNANNKYIGNVTLQYAISNSLNTVPVKILRELGNSESFNFLSKGLCIKSLNSQNDIGDASLALGQPSLGISLRELTSAYTIFQNGTMSLSRTYYKVTDSCGKVILDNSIKQNKVISYETASIMTKLMQTVLTEGTASGRISLIEQTEVAGKTGTTQFNFDKYFVGYTPTLLAGTWSGYEYPKSLNNDWGNPSLYIWDEIMNEIYNNTKFGQGNKKFQISSNVNELSFDSSTGLIADMAFDKDHIQNGWFDITK